VFTTEDAPSTAQDIKASYIPIVLDQWKEVKFKLTDKELTHTGERIITEHIRPAAYAIADTIDQALAANYNLIPWEVAASSPWAVVDVTGARQRLFDNKVNMKDPNNLWAMVDGTGENELLALSAFAQWQGAGAKGVDAQTEGELGRRYGFGFFANQNTPDHAAGSITSATPVVKTTVALGLKDIIADDGTMTGDVNIGDIFSIAGHTQQYVITADATAGSNEIDLAFEPALEAEATAEDAIVFSQNTGSQSLFFNRNWCALAMAPLSEMGGELGAKVATITDPVTGLSLRSRIYYVGNSSEVHVALDVLYGHKVLDGNRACRVWNA
jgi:hypothetical protein